MKQVAREPASSPCVNRPHLGQALQANLVGPNGCGDEGGGGGLGLNKSKKLLTPKTEPKL